MRPAAEGHWQRPALRLLVLLLSASVVDGVVRLLPVQRLLLLMLLVRSLLPA